MARALVIVDVQNDFCEGGSLAVDGGSAVAARVSEYLRDNASDYDLIAATRDWHIDPGDHFADEPNFSTSWPVHCVAESSGAEFHADIRSAVDFDDVVDVVVSKGRYDAAYSGFEGTTEDEVRLHDVLRARSVSELDIVGIATDHCVSATALDGVKLGYEVRVLSRMTAGVAPETTAQALEDFQAAGIIVE